jgi:hypothetical protein
MRSYLKRVVVWTTLVALITVFSGSMALAQNAQTDDRDRELKSGKMIADALLVRPLGLVATVAGGVVFVVSLPFSLLGRNTGEAFDRLLADPATFTFTRPLGEFD